MAEYDAYVLITKKGNYNSTQEWLNGAESKRVKMAEVYHQDTNVTFTVSSFVNRDNTEETYTRARSEEDLELLQNSDFESTSFAGNWVCPQCTMTIYSSDTYRGSRSVLVTNRRQAYSSPRQRVMISPGYNYIYSTYFKLLNLPNGTDYTTLDLKANVKNNGTSKFLRLGTMPLQQVKFGWTEIGGDFLAPDGATEAQIYITIQSKEINFIQDFASMKRLKPNRHWMELAKSRINRIRKAPISVRLSGPVIDGVDVELIQHKGSFPFGTAIKLDKFNVPEYQFFTDFVLRHFNWAVIANKLKWYGIERIQDKSDYSLSLAALDVLEAHGVESRGHNMFWGVEKFVNSWLYGMSPTELVAEMKSHVQEVINNTKARLAHWDVNNENLHGDWFERNTTDPDITPKMFQWIHGQEPETKLFLNDYSIIPKPDLTTAIKNQAVRFLKNNVPVHGIGAQSHFYTTDIDMDVIKYRLDKLSEAGLEIWATELTVDEPDDVKKAGALEKLLTMFYSHPSVGGVILWHFWNESLWHPNENLFDGPDLKPNAAGQKFLDLVHGDWKSTIKQSTTSGQTYNRTAFLGEYSLNVKRNGQVIYQINLTLDSAGKDISIYFTEDKQKVSHVQLGTWTSYSGQCVKSKGRRVAFTIDFVMLYICIAYAFVFSS
ncbi:uncharacterized protein LOC134232027 [Saccostrea cucullata]|uniref:uncharacterized protein LOC134232027 n=1 Tax=Saccostrea cuccullata TaxID=36930 RepID=UPI002ED28615